MRSSIFLVIGMLIFSCQSEQGNNRTPVIRSQAEADAYNATIVSQNDFVYCTEESFTGSKIEKIVCETVAQREQSASDAKSEVLDRLVAIPIN
jgi:hypothetical protein